EKGEGNILFSVFKEKEGWGWKSENEALTCVVDTKPVPRGALPYHSLLKGKRFTFSIYALKERLVIMAFDSQRPQVKAFSHLYYYPPASKYAVRATMEKYKKVEKLKMLTSRGEEKFYLRYAALRFEIDGKKMQLSAFKSVKSGTSSKYLFVPFNDKTNGKGSYPAGRFIEFPEPAKKEFLLDFNLCFNPLCNYAPVYNCPIPPMENNLETAIKAGEKEYPH
ncbi:MAG: DUF1684 domain-containing protein, partial [bacterium]|nr:DUF1684 domain-containing protein [bacterium]